MKPQNNDSNVEYPDNLTDKNVKNIVSIGNTILPMLAKKPKDRLIEGSVLSYILSKFRNKLISKQGQDTVTHADLFNWSDKIKKDKADDKSSAENESLTENDID